MKTPELPLPVKKINKTEAGLSESERLNLLPHHIAYPVAH